MGEAALAVRWMLKQVQHDDSTLMKLSLTNPRQRLADHLDHRIDLAGLDDQRR